MDNRTAANPGRKAKKSFTLSTESVAFLEELQRRNKAESVSSILEQILQSLRREKHRASIDRAVADYYSSLSDEEVAEQAEWGDFALRQFSTEDRT
jgi:hypothetical protein